MYVQYLEFSIILCYYVIYVDTFCFNQSVYIVEEGKPAVLTVNLSRVLPFDILVRFRYIELSAIGKPCVIIMLCKIQCLFTYYVLLLCSYIRSYVCTYQYVAT